MKRTHILSLTVPERVVIRHSVNLTTCDKSSDVEISLVFTSSHQIHSVHLPSLWIFGSWGQVLPVHSLPFLWWVSHPLRHSDTGVSSVTTSVSCGSPGGFTVPLIVLGERDRPLLGSYEQRDPLIIYGGVFTLIQSTPLLSEYRSTPEHSSPFPRTLCPDCKSLQFSAVLERKRVF